MRNEVEKLRKMKDDGTITKTDLAKEIGVSRSYITLLEQGKIKPSLKVSLKLVKYFKCRLEDIFKECH